MADITQTAANVVKGSGASVSIGTAGATIVAGDCLYLDTNNALQKALNDTAAHAAMVGIALDGGASGQPIQYLTSGDINPGGTVVVGETYVVSANAGKLAPVADISTKFLTHIGYGTSASNISVAIRVSGIAHA